MFAQLLALLPLLACSVRAAPANLTARDDTAHLINLMVWTNPDCSGEPAALPFLTQTGVSTPMIPGCPDAGADACNHVQGVKWTFQGNDVKLKVFTGGYSEPAIAGYYPAPQSYNVGDNGGCHQYRDDWTLEDLAFKACNANDDPKIC